MRTFVSSLLAILLLFSGVPASAQTVHNVKLTITDTTNPPGTTYNIYRGSAACSTNPTLTLLNTAPVTALTYTDTAVPAGTYCYAATAVGPGGESAKSPEAPAVILAPPNSVTITITVQ